MSPARILLAVLLASALCAAAQSTERPKPPGTVPFQDAPPPPPMPANDEGTMANDPKLQPMVTKRVQGDETIEEYRVAGKLYMMRVTPKHGVPYILMDHKGDGTFTKQENTLDQGLRVPQWVLLTF